jgi:hypothetical protein
MKQTLKHLASALLCTAMLITSCLTPTAVHAVPILGDEAYTEIAKTLGSNNCANTQGFAVSDTHLYSVQISSSNTRAFINRIDKKTGKNAPLRDASTRKTVISGLSHANSMDWAKIDGVEYLFILSSTKILVFTLDGTTMTAYAEYETTWNNAPITPYAFSLYDIDGDNITFLILLNNTLATATASLTEKTADMPVSIKGYVDVSAVPVDGKSVDCTDYLKQGICCDGEILYLIVTGNHVDATINHSLLLAYDLKKASTAYEEPIQPDPDRTRCIVSQAYPGLFEMEDIDIDSEGKMYFNTNSWQVKWGADCDAVCLLNDFTAEFSATWVNPFTDVKDTDWFYDEVEYVSARGMMAGTSDTTFAPADSWQRAQFVTALWRLDGEKKASKAADFTDVEAGQWYSEAIAWAAENKIVEGYGYGTFGTNDPITREQIVTILFRYYRYTGHLQVIAPAKPKHTCSDWAEKYVLWAEVNGLLSDMGADITDMTAWADRAEIAAYLTRFDRNLARK